MHGTFHTWLLLLLTALMLVELPNNYYRLSLAATSQFMHSNTSSITVS